MVVLSLHVCVKILYRGFNFFELHTGIDADGILGHFSMTFNAVGALAKKKKMCAGIQHPTSRFKVLHPSICIAGA